ncbi:AzlC family ABC transporter permease [Kribbella sp. VKM Ac-2568]|uniref:AzlC family ABC transporter permease n=1 Tax=Kribbella sp. VKM Ac-2568 TaxID=2512219 RepID=UPI0010E10FD9|nr:AzlC family ABC transporter permease [Kribbella sp. VKM Ac-2568]TCM48142.1 putative branched-subunit amino acid permease [Kribbella sp. VKM Ac-2568]
MRSLLGKTAPPQALALRDVASVAPGLAAFGMTLGVTISALGFGTLPGLVGAGVVYGGSAQLTAVTLVHQGAAFAVVVASAAIVNSRLLLYGASMSRRFRDQPTWFRWLAPHFVIDQTYLLSNARPDLDPRTFRRYWGWLGFLILVLWSSSIAVGIVAGPALPELPHLVFVGTAMFLGMLAPRLTNRPAVVAAVTGGLAAAVIGLVRPELGIVGGAIAGVIAGSAVRR